MSELKYVGPEGDINSRIALVGEQPAKYELRYGKPFSGPAGKNLNECLHEAGILRNACYLTNVIKDVEMPLEEYFVLRGGAHEKAEIKPLGKMYLEMLHEE